MKIALKSQATMEIFISYKRPLQIQYHGLHHHPLRLSDMALTCNCGMGEKNSATKAPYYHNIYCYNVGFQTAQLQITYFIIKAAYETLNKKIFVWQAALKQH